MIDLFISHSAKDAKIAESLIHLLQMGLTLSPSQIRCTSVDGYRLSGGVNTLEQLRQEVYEARTFIGIITNDSLRSAYVLFELGARWGADRPLIPLLAAGTPPTALLGPLSVLNALSCDNEAQIHQLVNDLAKDLDVSPNNPSSFLSHIQNLTRASNERILTGAPLVMILTNPICGEMFNHTLNQSNAMVLFPVTILNETNHAITPEFFTLNLKIDGKFVPFQQAPIPAGADFKSEEQIINIKDPHEWDLLRRIGSILPGAAVTGLLMFISNAISYLNVQSVFSQRIPEMAIQCTDVRGRTFTVLPRLQPPNVPGAPFRIGMFITPKTNLSQTGP